MKLIDKDKIVAEIKKRIRTEQGYSSGDAECGYRDCAREILSFLDTLEVKEPYENCIQYDSIKAGIQANAETYSFNIESKLFNQLTKEQQELWVKEIEQAYISGGETGVEFARDTRYKENLETKETASIWNDARKTIPEDSSNQIICIKEDDLAVATIGKLVRGTKKWAYLNDLLNISDVKTKDGDVEKELERLDSLLFDLDGIAIAGTTSYLTVEDLKAIAKSFFELGLKAQIGE